MYKFAMTPRFYETKIDRLISIEQKYYPFFEKHNATLNLVPFSGQPIETYLNENKPDAIIFAGGYRMYTEEIKKFEYSVMKHSLARNIPILAICCGMFELYVESYFESGGIMLGIIFSSICGFLFGFIKYVESRNKV